MHNKGVDTLACHPFATTLACILVNYFRLQLFKRSKDKKIAWESSIKNLGVWYTAKVNILNNDATLRAKVFLLQPCPTVAHYVCHYVLGTSLRVLCQHTVDLKFILYRTNETKRKYNQLSTYSVKKKEIRFHHVVYIYASAATLPHASSNPCRRNINSCGLHSCQKTSPVSGNNRCTHSHEAQNTLAQNHNRS